jgi:HEPN domain-containing protein
MDRYSSMMVSNVAGDYLEAAKITASQKSDKFKPSYFLVCRSLELSLKAFLRGSGYSESQLLKIRHDLEKCVDKAVVAGLDGYVSLSEDDRALISAANVYYKSKDFEYTITGYKSRRPRAQALIRLAERVWRGLRDFCVNHRTCHFEKPTAVL